MEIHTRNSSGDRFNVVDWRGLEHGMYNMKKICIDYIDYMHRKTQ